MRPQGDDLKAAIIHAKHLRDLGVTVTVGFRGVIRGGCPLDRAGVGAEQAFQAIAEANGGAVFLFDPAHLTERFSEIAERAHWQRKAMLVAPKRSSNISRLLRLT